MTTAKQLLFVLVSMLTSASAFAQLTLSPGEIDVKNYSPLPKIVVRHAGKPVSPDEITKIVSGVYKTGNEVFAAVSADTHFSDYSYMFDMEVNNDGSITLTPNQGVLEIGTYDLFVHTIYGTAKGRVDANLREEHPVKQRSGLPPSSLTYDIDLPDYYFGQVISLDLKPDDKTTYTWYIDGEIHSSGLGQTSFRAQPSIGEHEISFIAVNADGVEVSSWSDTVRVMK